MRCESKKASSSRCAPFSGHEVSAVLGNAKYEVESRVQPRDGPPPPSTPRVRRVYGEIR